MALVKFYRLDWRILVASQLAHAINGANTRSNRGLVCVYKRYLQGRLGLTSEAKVTRDYYIGWQF